MALSLFLLVLGRLPIDWICRDTCRIHLVVHVSQLKKHVPQHVSVEEDISNILDDPEAVLQPVAFLGTRMIQKGASSISWIQVQWDAYKPYLTT